jgi:hypothetical protein
MLVGGVLKLIDVDQANPMVFAQTGRDGLIG